MESWWRQILERAKALAKPDVTPPAFATPTQINESIGALSRLAKPVREAHARVLAAELRSRKPGERPDWQEWLCWVRFSVPDLAKLAELPADDAVELLGVAT